MRKKRGALRLPENIDHKLHLCGRVASARAVHACVEQALLQSGSGMYPLVELIYGSLLCYIGDVEHRQLTLPVTADEEELF